MLQKTEGLFYNNHPDENGTVKVVLVPGLKATTGNLLGAAPVQPGWSDQQRVLLFPGELVPAKVPVKPSFVAWQRALRPVGEGSWEERAEQRR